METENQKKLFSFLDKLNIKTETYAHEPVYTVEQAHAIAHNVPGGQCKNLF